MKRIFTARIGPRIEWLIIGLLSAALGVSALFVCSYSYQVTYYLATFDFYRHYRRPVHEQRLQEIDRVARDFWMFLKKERYEPAPQPRTGLRQNDPDGKTNV